MGALGSLAAGAPLVLLAPWLSGLPPASFADDVTHARVAAELAEAGLGRGWVESYLGGFPLAVHYPVVGWFASAALIGLGLSPLGATHLLGWLAIVSTPLALYAGLVRCGGRPLFAWLGALGLAWVSPYNAFVGGYASFFDVGLLSQVLALPIGVLWVSAMVRSRTHALPVTLAVLAVLTHPQLAVATLMIGSLACLVAARAEPLSRCVRSGVAALAVAAAVYGPGILTLEVPFGWPPGFGWRHLGFPPERLEHWLIDGALLDLGRPAVITHLAGVSALALVLQSKRPAARAALAAAVLTLALSVSGRSLESLGTLGSWLLSFLQPMRVTALAPVVAALLVSVALEESLPRVIAAFVRPGLARPSTLALSACVLGILLFALPDRVEYLRATRDHLISRATHPCGPSTPEGYDSLAARRWLANLAGGRLWYPMERGDPVQSCAIADALELASAVPIAVAGGVGAHVGVLATASSRLEPTRAGSASRAEALGVEHALISGDAEPPQGWRRAARSGSALQLWSLERAPSIVGAGCVTEVWRGSDAELRRRIFSALEAPEGVDRVLSPTSWVALEGRRATADEGRCDERTAQLDVHRAERGLVEATVHSETPVDVVLRVTAFAGWRVTLDGAPVEPRRVAPGFPAVRVPAGRHRLVAEVGWLPGYLWGVPLALLVASATTLRRRPPTGRAAKAEVEPERLEPPAAGEREDPPSTHASGPGTPPP